jgi:ABC-type nitrate/sulfonate/bicarbonate transport system ATPase subunit
MTTSRQLAPPAFKVRVQGVSKTFSSSGSEDIPALDTITMALRDGEFVSIVGPSGCGKSTLFNIIAGLTPPTTGRVFIDDRDVTGKTGLVGYMLQKDLLLPWKPVVDNVALGLVMLGEHKAVARQRASALLHRYGLGDFERHYPWALSGGMRQRVALMRTLLYAKDVLLLDEPFGALDSQTRFIMQKWLLDVWQENRRSVLFITHDVDEAIFLSDRVFVMSRRPGSLKEEFIIPLPRPRTLDMLTVPDFTATKGRLFGLIHDESMHAFGQPELAGRQGMTP